eukprot:gnl/MRDRNA2_/MRDRNA2_140178_c0_seq1.p1 gnl/MRDRNA2_/MRDRNA2_140178_c0~~gnl/MRDRNA2_/MRDRNA2_140178_c0_seq1.p1  ORF type:complete len:250 (-),score=54.81 gnl/MRDRNA2_/MRDRNA2_140178_c0_seq1:228-977(-)
MADWLLGDEPSAENQNAGDTKEAEPASLASRQQMIKDLFNRARGSDEDSAESDGFSVRSSSPERQRRSKRSSVSRRREDTSSKGSRQRESEKTAGKRQKSSSCKEGSEQKRSKDHGEKLTSPESTTKDKKETSKTKSQKEADQKIQNGSKLHPAIMMPPWAMRPGMPPGYCMPVPFGRGGLPLPATMPCPYHGTPAGCKMGKTCAFQHSEAIAGRNAERIVQEMAMMSSVPPHPPAQGGSQDGPQDWEI